MQSSQNLVRFVQGFEGFASKAYLCPAGVVTIGWGFTGGDPVFSAYWKTKTGHALRMGDTITREEADGLLGRILDEDYGVPVVRVINPTLQQVYDGSTSACFNFGAGGLKWNWAKALAAGDIPHGAAMLRVTATTANGRQLAGLVRRRDAEATVIETGRYPGVVGKQPPLLDEVKQYTDWLVQLGYPDGSDASIRRFQGANGLKVDGDVGSATRATLIRALDAKKAANATVGGAVAGGGGGLATQTDPATFDLTQLGHLAPWIILAAVVVFIGFTIYRNRGAITGQRVPT